MEPYWKSTEDSEYLKFYDCTENIEKSYERKIDCFRLPQGTIIPVDVPPYGNRFLICDGKVYEREAGLVHQPRRTKRAKRIRALPNYPLMKKRYPDLRTFADARFGFEYSEKEQAYGYYMNPNGMWTRFRIGGRWACLLLVKDDCEEYSDGEASRIYQKYNVPSPEGYCWVSGARMKDIEWQAMKDCYIAEMTERFRKLEGYFYTDLNLDSIHVIRTDKGIYINGKYEYRCGDSLEDYLEREARQKDFRYVMIPHDFLDMEGNWHSVDDIQGLTEDETQKVWTRRVGDFLDSLSGDDVLVIVDYLS